MIRNSVWCRTVLAAVFGVALAAGCGRNVTPKTPPAEVAANWWRAVASGDAAAANGYVAGDAAARTGAQSVSEYARVAKAAAEGDPAARRMLEKLSGIAVGKVDAGPDLAMVRLVAKDGTTFMSVRLEVRNGRWVIVELI